MATSREQELVNILTEASSAYYTNGKSKLSDEEFDSLSDELKQLNPNLEFFSKREFHNEDEWNYKLCKLPSKLYSIKKIKTEREILDWKKFLASKLNMSLEDIDKELVCLSPKYDGIKLLSYNNSFYTRYETGEEGYDVTNRIKNSIKSKESGLNTNCEGELILTKQAFQKNCVSLGYTSSRNCIPAIFSSKERVSYIDKVSYMRYSIYGTTDLNKDKQIESLNLINVVKVPYLLVPFNELTEEVIVKFYEENTGNFECDGVVVDLNNSSLRNQLGETQKYVDYCRAYKGDALFNDVKESKIKKIVWQNTRYGKLAPVAQIEPVIIDEGVVSNVALYNAAYIEQENIYEGQIIKVTRKGKINPKIVEFLTHEKKASLPTRCPICGCPLEWDENHVDLYCSNKNCGSSNIQKIYFFFKTIGVKEFGLKTVEAFYYNGFESLLSFFDRRAISEVLIDGIGSLTKDKFFRELDRIKEEGVSLEVLQEASGCFSGISSKTFKTLNTLHVDIEYLYKDSYYNEIIKKAESLEGIGHKTAEEYTCQLDNFWKFYNKIKNYISVKKENKEGVKKINKTVCFTGFRDKKLKAFTENLGIEVKDSFSKSLDMLIALNVNSSSSKIQKAKENNIEILSKEDFEKKIGYKK